MPLPFGYWRVECQRELERIARCRSAPAQPLPAHWSPGSTNATQAGESRVEHVGPRLSCDKLVGCEVHKPCHQ